MFFMNAEFIAMLDYTWNRERGIKREDPARAVSMRFFRRPKA